MGAYFVRQFLLKPFIYPHPFPRFASTIFQQYVASDDGSENLATLKRLHGLMPYFMLKTALKVSNPMAMIRGKISDILGQSRSYTIPGVLDLFLATPFGGKSLLQRYIISSVMCSYH